MDLNWLQDVLKSAGCQEPFDIRIIPEQETWILVPPENLYPLVKLIIEYYPPWHLTTITGQDTGKALEIMYHFWLGQGITFCIRLPYENPEMRSITSLIPGAAFYEREIIEMLGVNDPDLSEESLLFLPEAWGKGWPLRIKKEEVNDD